MSEWIYAESLVSQIKEILQEARTSVMKKANTELLTAYWHIGEIITNHEENHGMRAAYGKQMMRELSRVLTQEFGKGFSVSNIQFMRRFYQNY